jgi:phosphatidylinositol alpha-mannosyltransferase
VLGLQHLGWHAVAASVLASSPSWVLAAIGLMCTSMLLRAVSWHAILRAVPLTTRARLADAMQGTAIGVLMSATLPARLGELSRALIVSRRLGRPRELVAPVLGTLVCQTALNAVALTILGAVVATCTGFAAGDHLALVAYAVVPLLVAAVVGVLPLILRSGGRSRVARALATASAQLRSGLAVARRPGLALRAAAAQLGAWALQWLACLALLAAVGIEPHGAAAAAAAVLFAVNVTAALPVTPSNIGVFQAACVAVLASAYHVNSADALGYGIVLQAVELATAVVLGAPALVREGVTWREVRLRALHSAPITLAGTPRGATADA